MDLEDFPDEILCQLFQYFNSFDVLYSFLNLNSRFNAMLTPFKRNIDLTNVSYQQFIFYIDKILCLTSQDEPLYAIKLGNIRTPGQIELFNKLMEETSYEKYFNNIRTVEIESPLLDELRDFVKNFLTLLSNLTSLALTVDNIRDKDFQVWTKLLVHSILSISTLVKLSIEMPTGLVLSHLQDTLIFRSLVDVTLTVTLVTDLLILIQHIPNVEYLTIRVSWWTSGDRTLVKMLNDLRSRSVQASLLCYLKSFHLTVDSVLTFQFEHLEQVLYLILSNETTRSFGFILRQYLNRQPELSELIDGTRWERLLLPYSSLNEFNLFIRINGSIQIEQQQSIKNSFQSPFFNDKHWKFSCCTYLSESLFVFYSVPYQNKELFDITIRNETELADFPVNHATSLLFNQRNQKQYDFNQFSFDVILKRFPYVQELHLMNFPENFSITNPINIPSLQTLKVEKEQMNISDVLTLLPLINSLFISYNSINHSIGSIDAHQYDRIIELSIAHIPADDLKQLELFLNRFVRLRYLHLHLHNQRVTEEYFLTNLHRVIHNLRSITYLKLKLEKDFSSPVNWTSEWNGRVRMHFTETIFSGILIHLWF